MSWASSRTSSVSAGFASIATWATISRSERLRQLHGAPQPPVRRRVGQDRGVFDVLRMPTMIVRPSYASRAVRIVSASAPR